jgi:hypothetical protein
MSDEFESEPIRGLPAYLPPGERLLWQGAPNWKALAIGVFHVRAVALYFAVMIGWHVQATLAAGSGLAAAAFSALPLLALSCAAIGILALIAWLVVRTTVYSITSRRVVLRFGIALPITMNIPFRVITSAALRTCRDGTGEIPLTLGAGNRAAYLLLWPHVRPWRLGRAEPTLRFVPEAAHVAGILSGALKEAAEAQPSQAPDAQPAPIEANARPLATAAA